MQDTELTLQAGLGILVRQARLIAATLAAGVCLAVLYLLLAEPEYRATSLLIVDPAGSDVLDDAPVTTGSENARVESEVEILRSEAMALAAARRAGLTSESPGVAAPARDRLEGTVTDRAAIEDILSSRRITRRGLTHLIAITATANSPAEAARIANAYAETYLERQVAAKVARVQTARDVLGAQMKAAQDAVASSEAALDRFVVRSAGEDMSEAILDAKLSSGALPSSVSSRILLLQQNAAIARAQHQSLMSRLRDLEVDVTLQLADARIVSRAMPPAAPSAPDRTMVLALAVAASLAVGSGIAFASEYHFGGITSEDQLARLAASPVPTTLPHLSGHEMLSPADMVVRAPLSPYAEGLRKLRAALDRSWHLETRPEKQGMVVLLASGDAGEGKSTIALALARTYAEAGKRAMLIDGDLRAPTIHDKLGIRSFSSLVAFLTDETGSDMLDQYYVDDPMTDAGMILGAGRSGIATDKLVASDLFERMVEEARSWVDVLILDSPPLLPVVDARYMAPLADAVVLVARHAVTRPQDLRRAAADIAEYARPGAARVAVLNARKRHRLPYAASEQDLPGPLDARPSRP
ncbi:tyrosine-protein kinase domain-containing protein [Tropicimonas sp. IMCC34011]|uniref:tyrosine-protein kinase domain-containing protein n=1 Tax=Tropicimonas sp. IMCC34011 TaxID=2248759 RepID=UPI000E2288FC|nr:tyrosine-protein kinase domain-containing protein [Tropicimonas sp. IMCC34011]